MNGSFFCEYCGAEVKADADACPSCGRPFLGVRCPRCSHEGTAREFKDGCPSCGYLESADSVETTPMPHPRKQPRRRREWPASRYWSLSILLLFAISAILYFWLKSPLR